MLILVVWPWFAWLYLRTIAAGSLCLREGCKLGVFWVVVIIVADFMGWVLVPHIWQMTLEEFYLDCQPWITLV